MGLLDVFRGRQSGVEVERSAPLALAFDEWAAMASSFMYSGVQYTLPGASQENIGSSFPGLARGAAKGNGIVFACIANRVDLFSEARFMYRRLRNGRPGDLFGTADLGLLNRPWEGGTTGDLLARMLQYVDIAGNAYVALRPGRLTPLRPDWTSIIAGVPGNPDASIWHRDARVLGYMYQEGGPGGGNEPDFFLPEEMAHFAPRPDPEARFRGMSWLTPIIRQIMADKAMDDHKLAFFENGATPNIAVKLDTDSLEKFKAFVAEFDKNHAGASNAYKTMWLAAGADVVPVGTDLRQLDFKITQGAGETRIAAAAGVPPVIVGLSEGLAAATYSNYSQARRRFADQTMRPLWRNACASLARITRVPGDAELWYDDRDIKALQEDQEDSARIMQIDASSAQTLVNSGFTPESSVAAIAARDLTLLVHTGLLSVQLQDPTAAPPDAPDASEDDEVPAKRDDPLDMLEHELMRMLRDQDDRHISVNVNTPDVTVLPASVTVEPAQITLEPQRFEEGAIQVRVDPPDVNVTVEPAAVTVEPTRFEEGAIQVTVEPAEAPNVSVNVEPAQVTVERSGKRTVDFGDGRSATVVDGDVKKITYDDGREVTITEVDE